jgi:hypothetical protein
VIAATYAHTVRVVKRTCAQVVTLLVALALTAALVVVWIRVVRVLTVLPPPSPPIGQPQAIVWDRHVFTSDRQLKRFLTARGISYTTWVSKHPSAFAVVKHKLQGAAVESRPRRRAGAHS